MYLKDRVKCKKRLFTREKHLMEIKFFSYLHLAEGRLLNYTCAHTVQYYQMGRKNNCLWACNF